MGVARNVPFPNVATVKLPDFFRFSENLWEYEFVECIEDRV